MQGKDFVNMVLKLYDRKIISHKVAFDQLLDGAVNRSFADTDIPDRPEFDWDYVRKTLTTEFIAVG